MSDERKSNRSGMWQPVLAAFLFLTRFPVRAELDFTPELLRRSARYYPLVGAAVGLSAWTAAILSSWLLPPLPAAVLALIVWVWVSGGLHLDGWMDTADGLLSYRPREKMLEIMKDSRVGAMGVLACVLLLMLKASLLASLLQGGAWQTGAALLTAPIWSRWFMTRAMRLWPDARQGEGLAGHFRGFGAHDARGATVWAIMLTVAALLPAVLLVILPISVQPISQTMKAGLTLHGGIDPALVELLLYACLHPLLAWAAGTWAARWMSAKLGGLTGDTYGALNEGLEAALLLLAVLIFR
ncbi:adenosylcobinamide-GDP ribazoletransferase [Paenibacillus macerans]|uniref:adenosylcobinamide-GDP ribazoletransferase n=1 Tax=Paenibacillus macerans TaxID=44252 RepID=UPI002040E1B2|nr:adenosylcobinamide-GDP ribazoletransferase [Paenibacillus macerans]MCM3699876.1 adenosylcobinamide-GDP ribazoletransferase [Paenibacillus macerans]